MTDSGDDKEKTERQEKGQRKETGPPGPEGDGIRIEETSDASAALEAASSIMPGLMGLVEDLKKTGPFQERMKEIDEELKRRLKEEGGREKKPRVSCSFSVRTLQDGPPISRPPSAHGKQAPRKPQPQQVKVEKTNLGEEDRLVEVVEMTEALLILVELRGLDEHDIHLELLSDHGLLLLARRDGVELFRKEIPLPTPVTKEFSSDSRNGILTVRLRKSGS